MELNHIAIIASSMETVHFFERFGFYVVREIERKFDVVVLMCNNNISLEIFVDSSHPLIEEGKTEPVGLRHLSFAVDNIEQLMNEFDCGPIRKDWFGNRYTTVKTPDGMVVELMEDKNENRIKKNAIDHKKLTLMYITNDPKIAAIADRYGVNRVWVDLETKGKEERQKNLNTVKSKHSISDIPRVKAVLKQAEMLVRINPWGDGSVKEVDDVIKAGADIIMLPYWKTAEEVSLFLKAVNGRVKTTVLLETKEAVECIDEVLKLNFDEIHIGLNDLHLSYGMTFMFELLSNGTVETLCNKFKTKDIPYGFGGIAKLGDGLLPAERIIMEHYRIGSSRAILSRTFCDNALIESVEEIDRVFKNNMKLLREFEDMVTSMTQKMFMDNKADVSKSVSDIVENIKRKKRYEC